MSKVTRRNSALRRRASGRGATFPPVSLVPLILLVAAASYVPVHGTSEISRDPWTNTRNFQGKPSTNCMCSSLFLLLLVRVQGCIQRGGGGALGFPPSSLSSPPPELGQSQRRIQKVFWGSMPPDPLEAALMCVPPHKKILYATLECPNFTFMWCSFPYSSLECPHFTFMWCSFPYSSLECPHFTFMWCSFP